jgi:hypothetical protein
MTTKTKALVQQLVRMLDEGMHSVSFGALSDWHEDNPEGYADATIEDLLRQIIAEGSEEQR